jgi:hypothetical protein
VYATARDTKTLDLPGVEVLRLDITDPASVAAVAPDVTPFSQGSEVYIAVPDPGRSRTACRTRRSPAGRGRRPPYDPGRDPDG